MLAVPHTRQKKQHDCGEACARAVLGYWELRYPRLSAAGWPSPIDGTDPRVIEALLRKSGLMVQTGEMTLATLKHHLKNLWPVICLVREGRGGHYVVVTRVARGRVWMMDPGEPDTISEPQAEFLSRWHAGDVCRTGATYQQWAIAAGI